MGISHDATNDRAASSVPVRADVAFGGPATGAWMYHKSETGDSFGEKLMMCLYCPAITRILYCAGSAGPLPILMLLRTNFRNMKTPEARKSRNVSPATT